jgi:site-specific DNA recombinase
MLTIAYARVSTEHQTDHSPEAQRRRAIAYAKARDIGPVRTISDEGLSGKNLDRPGIQELIELVEADQVAHIIVWRIDRLSRSTADISRLLDLFDKHSVGFHSMSEGAVEVASASGRMQAGIQGVLAQFQREQIVENILMGNDQAIHDGYWLNRPPTGYDTKDKVLMANDDAHLVRLAFKGRAAGKSYPALARETGLNYSTVRHMLENRVYLGFTRRRDEWFPGRHDALVTQDEFDAAQRAHVPGRRRGSDLLSGRVRCGECGKITAIDTNGRNQPIYRCRHRGNGCNIPGRSAAGLHRAARLGLDLLRTDDQLFEAIRAQLAPDAREPGAGAASPNRAGSLASLRRKRDKLMGLYLDEKITDDYFGEQERSLTAKIEAIEKDHSEATTERKNKTILADAFEQAAALIRSPEFTLDDVWDNASQAERRVLVEELIEAVTIYADRLEVTVAGAPPLIVQPGEVRLRDPGTGPVVSKMGLEPTRPLIGH